MAKITQKNFGINIINMKQLEQDFRDWLKTTYGIQDYNAYKNTQTEEIAIRYAVEYKHSKLVKIIQLYVNTVEGIFDRDPKQLSLEEYQEYLDAYKECNGIVAFARKNEIEDYLIYEQQL